MKDGDSFFLDILICSFMNRLKWKSKSCNNKHFNYIMIRPKWSVILKNICKFCSSITQGQFGALKWNTANKNSQYITRRQSIFGRSSKMLSSISNLLDLVYIVLLGKCVKYVRSRKKDTRTTPVTSVWFLYC